MATFGPMKCVYDDRADWTLENVLREKARAHPDRVFLRFPEDQVVASYGDVLSSSESVAGALAAQGGAPGDRVVIFARNSYAFVQAWFGSTLAGMVEAPINADYRGGFLEHQCNLVGARIAVVDADLTDRLVESRAALRYLERVYVIGETVEPAVDRLLAAGWEAAPFSELTEHAAPPKRVHSKPWDLGMIIFTSGTTGLSKGVMLSNGHAHAFAEGGVLTRQLTSDDVLLTMGPLFHANAQVLGIYPTLLTGGQVVVRRRFSASLFGRWLQQDQITVANLIGVMMEFACNQEQNSYDRENPLRRVTTVPWVPALAEVFKERFGVEEVITGYGMTEVGIPIVSPWGVARPQGSIGAIVDDWYDARVVNPETDEEVADGEVGELVLRNKIPYLLCDGYFGMPEKTVEDTKNLWFHTGDALKRDEEGWYYFIDRYKDALRRRGENISAQEVEDVLCSHPQIADCGVIGVPADEASGEDEVMAFVVPASGSDLSEQTIALWCDDHLPSFASPRYIRFIDEIPRTPTEKKRRTELRNIGVDAKTWDRIQVLDNTER